MTCSPSFRLGRKLRRDEARLHCSLSQFRVQACAVDAVETRLPKWVRQATTILEGRPYTIRFDVDLYNEIFRDENFLTTFDPIFIGKVFYF